MITGKEEMTSYLNKYSYLVIFPDKKTQLFKSLREIQTAIHINASTISKILNMDDHFFSSKKDKKLYYIIKTNRLFTI